MAEDAVEPMEGSSEQKLHNIKDMEYCGSTRFELELEFVQQLGNGFYLNHLAAQKLFEKAEFVAYLEYLQYWKRPEYARFLSYPGPSLKALELLQQEQFRKDIIMPGVMAELMQQIANASIQDR